MSDDKEKKFVYKHVFENMRIACYLQGPKEKHFGVSWQLKLYKDYYDGIAYFIAYFNCESLQTGNWSINTTCDIFVNGKPFSTGENFRFGQRILSLDKTFKFGKIRSPLNRWDLSKNDIQKYGIDDSATIEVRVKINEMTGLFRDFDDYFAKESSDVVLTVGDHKFHVYKNYLSLHSTYFKTLFSGNYAESEKSIIELKDIDPKEFHTFLGIIYGFLVVEESNVKHLLKLADFFDAKIVTERCEQFLMKISINDFPDKFQLSLKYKLDNLKKKCLSEMNKNTDFARLAPWNYNAYSAEIWKELYLKAVSSL
ncbi:hypothetical protein L5515_015764 [Caenorhabditis briggsae]|uniref:BTB domain-containing protein n=1 Tax=Caenorhabditis briggsae TaxID=6238 RepID=A0AAE9EFT3_CAEBR|nr:hypothetical protein L5515_015764 [Caenorhabditis briggsae]